MDLKNITIDNDSINKNGFAVEPTIELKWESDTPDGFVTPKYFPRIK